VCLSINLSAPQGHCNQLLVSIDTSYTAYMLYNIYIIHDIFKHRICYTSHTASRRLIGSPKLQIIFHKRATKYRSLLRKMIYKYKGSYESSPPYMVYIMYVILRICCIITSCICCITRLIDTHRSVTHTQSCLWLSLKTHTQVCLIQVYGVSCSYISICLSTSNFTPSCATRETHTEV